jgi:hypothetical protein
MKSNAILAAALLAALAPLARAEVVETSANTLKIKQIATVRATPAKAWQAMLDIGGWWSGEHTYSGNAANLRLEPRAGGCWCETLPNGGGVEHMHVVYFAPPTRVTMTGGLGPLQTAGVAGSMTLQVTPKGTGAEIALLYNVGGYDPGGLAAVAPGVDSVLTEQFARLARLIDSGSAEEKKP